MSTLSTRVASDAMAIDMQYAERIFETVTLVRR